ncbi:AbfB domain-containing protein [Corynebacterium sp. H127]|uniref:AbfB domain-containing protein n=1 Tax=Corynebacterium sp. H127 TaxID=3133418 RepID=UPI00309D5FC6
MTRRTSLTRRARHLAALSVATLLTLTPTAHAADTVTIFDGDGGLIQQTCGATTEQIRIDASSFPSMSACFGMAKPTGWIATKITGSYGVVNNLTVPAHIAFKLPDGAVYWQETVAPGKVTTIDVGRTGSTVVEIQVTPVATSTGPATGTLTPSTDTAPNYISLRQATTPTAGRILRVNWNGITTTAMDRNAGFTDRLDGSFKVIPALDGSSCISLESAAYPGTYLTAPTATTLSLSHTPQPNRATWCPAPAATPATAQQLRLAADQTKTLAATTTGAVTLAGTTATGTAWFVDTALARP